jgi:hypothetical protein
MSFLPTQMARGGVCDPKRLDVLDPGWKRVVFDHKRLDVLDPGCKWVVFDHRRGNVQPRALQQAQRT